MANTLGDYFNSLVLKIGVGAGVIQGVIWGILSLIAIIWHIVGKEKQYVSYPSDTYPYLLDSHMFYTFIKNNGNNTTMYIQPNGFFFVMIFYFFISIAWIGASIYMLVAYKHRFEDTKIKLPLILWIVAAITNLILDLVFFIFLAIDYDSAIEYYEQTHDMVLKLAYIYSTIGYGIVMVLAARGFALWVMNLLLTVMIIKIYFQLKLISSNEVYNEDIYSVYPERTRAYASSLPDEVRNYGIDEIPVRRQTAPPLSPMNDGVSTSSFVPGRNLYRYDPEVERRLSRYKITPNQIKNRFKFF